MEGEQKYRIYAFEQATKVIQGDESLYVVTISDMTIFLFGLSVSEAEKRIQKNQGVERLMPENVADYLDTTRFTNCNYAKMLMQAIEQKMSLNL